MKKTPLLVCAVALGLFASGCGGGSSDSAQTIPPAPPLTVPGNKSAPPITDLTTTTPVTTVPSSTVNSGSAPTSSGTPSSSQGSGQSQQTPAPSGGTQAPSPGTPTTPTTTTPPPPNGGVSPGKSKKFCNENPGAC